MKIPTFRARTSSNLHPLAARLTRDPTHRPLLPAALVQDGARRERRDAQKVRAHHQEVPNVPRKVRPSPRPSPPRPSTCFQASRNVLTFIRDEPFPNSGRPKSWNPRARRRTTRSVTAVCSSHPPPRVIPRATGSAARGPPRFRPSPRETRRSPSRSRSAVGSAAAAKARAADFSVPWRRCSEGCTSSRGRWNDSNDANAARPRWRRRDERARSSREYPSSCAQLRRERNVNWAPTKSIVVARKALWVSLSAFGSASSFGCRPLPGRRTTRGAFLDG